MTFNALRPGGPVDDAAAADRAGFVLVASAAARSATRSGTPPSRPSSGQEPFRSARRLDGLAAVFPLGRHSPARWPTPIGRERAVPLRDDLERAVLPGPAAAGVRAFDALIGRPPTPRSRREPLWSSSDPGARAEARPRLLAHAVGVCRRSIPADNRDGSLRLLPLRPTTAVRWRPRCPNAALYEFIGGAPPPRQSSATCTPGGALVRRAGEAWHNWAIRLVADGALIRHVQATVSDNGGLADIAWILGIRGRVAASQRGGDRDDRWSSRRASSDHGPREPAARGVGDGRRAGRPRAHGRDRRRRGGLATGVTRDHGSRETSRRA